MILPTVISITVGGLRLTPGRIFLILNFFPSVRNVLAGRDSGKDKVDIVIIVFSLWCFFSFWINHGFGVALETGGVLILETVTPYMVARHLLVDTKSFDLLVSRIMLIIKFMLFILLFESITSINLVAKIIHPMMGVSYHDGIGERLGFTRARGTFDHPIISGIFCSSMIGMAWFYDKRKRIKVTFTVFLASITSLSSGAIAAILVQGMVIVWEKYSRNKNKRWRLLLTLIVLTYVVIDLISNRSGLQVILSYLTFSPATAYWRTLIWDYGILNAYDNPFFGLGLHDWVRPRWMHSGSMDNFFLVIMVRHGFPAFGLLAYSILSITFRLLYLKSVDKRMNDLRRGWLTGLVGLCISACTVHYWNQAYIYFIFYLGFGAALLKYIEKNNEG